MAAGRSKSKTGRRHKSATLPPALRTPAAESLRAKLPERAESEPLHAGPIDGRELVDALNQIALGNFSVRLSSHEVGLLGKAYDSFNRVAELIETSTAEFERISTAVGKEGNVGERVRLPGAPGGWLARIDSLNSLIVALVQPINEVSRVLGSVANGDLSPRMVTEINGRPLKGQILQISGTVNTMVDRLNAFASEVTRVAREVGSEGILGGQALVSGVSGTWKDLTDNVNVMAANLTSQVRNIAEVTTAVAKGDLTRKITVDVKGEILELKNTINTMVDRLNAFASEVTRVAREVGSEGILGGQAVVSGVSGTWKDLTDNVNVMAANLTSQVRNIAEVTTAVAKGDLTRKITVDVKGEILELKNTINTMVDQLSSFASEVTRVAREVGSEGTLGAQAVVQGVGGIWKDLTDNVNIMAANLTDQVRNIAEVVTSVANGDLRRMLIVEAKGEIAELADTINAMIATLATFTDQVTSVAREVGVEGRLGGQASVPGAAGTWKDLTENVNQLAANLTTQVRAIADVATAVTKGDLTQSIAVKAKGEVAALKDNLNQMIAKLRETTKKNADQDWLKTNLAQSTGKLQGQRDLFTVAKLILSDLAPLVGAQAGGFFLMESLDGVPALRLISSYALRERKGFATIFRVGEGLVGQCALEKERILITNVPPDHIKISTGIGESLPYNIVVLPVLFEGDVKAVIELASFSPFSDVHLTFLDQLTASVGIVLNTLAANQRTEEFLSRELNIRQKELRETNARLEKQATSLRESESLLKKQQEELQKTNEELQDKARLLEAQKSELEGKNRQIERARQALQEKAEQLELTSQYKSEFLANMSHELRTPLNSLLILAKNLADNPDQNLMPKQVEQAKVIHQSGSDLLALISDILNMSKIESGKVELELEQTPLSEVSLYAKRTFTALAEAKGLALEVRLSEHLPATIHTDIMRLRQILKNLLSNAIKFTRSGTVDFSIDVAQSGWSSNNVSLNTAAQVIAFAVRDTGIGIAPDKIQVIFAPFQQAEAGTAREFGGTGLGLTICLELARLLGGEIGVKSTVGIGSTFTLYLPRTYQPRPSGVEEIEVKTPPPGVATKPKATLTRVEDDRETIQPGDRIALIVEDDLKFAKIVLDAARGKGFKCVIESSGDRGLECARKLKPSIIILDVRLPQMDGWAFLDQLKREPAIRHIPVQIISVVDDEARGLRMGAFAYQKKPVTKDEVETALDNLAKYLARKTKSLLIVEENETERQNLLALVSDPDVISTAVASGKEAIAIMGTKKFDCIVVDLELHDMSGRELIRKIGELLSPPKPPVIVYTAKHLTEDQEKELKEIAQSIIIKGVHSPEQLVAQTTIALHLDEGTFPNEKRDIIDQAQERYPSLEGKKILIVDDNLQNIFALTTILERHKITALNAENGVDGIKALRQNPNVDLVLMDIMMPGMDGYQTIQAIRKIDEFRQLPIIALTAKAMAEDRERCIATGATSYIAKPVEPDRLLSLIRVCLSAEREPGKDG